MTNFRIRIILYYYKRTLCRLKKMIFFVFFLCVKLEEYYFILINNANPKKTSYTIMRRKSYEMEAVQAQEAISEKPSQNVCTRIIWAKTNTHTWAHPSLKPQVSLMAITVTAIANSCARVFPSFELSLSILSLYNQHDEVQKA